VETLHRELDLDGVVTLTGHRPDATRLMAACDLFALASQWEGLPVAVMEALALGLPIVATAVGGVAETFTDGVDARLVPPGDAAALADAILDVAHDESLRTKLAAASSARAEEFDAPRAQRRIEEIYRTVARAR
jgi:glycosyltransferase involved in cell wall biosynthesis